MAEAEISSPRQSRSSVIRADCQVSDEPRGPQANVLAPAYTLSGNPDSRPLHTANGRIRSALGIALSAKCTGLVLCCQNTKCNSQSPQEIGDTLLILLFLPVYIPAASTFRTLAFKRASETTAIHWPSTHDAETLLRCCIGKEDSIRNPPGHF